MNENTLRIETGSAKIGAYPAMIKVFFATNDGRIWKQTITTAFEKRPKISLMDVTEYAPSNWKDLSVNDLDLLIATKALDDLINLSSE